MLYHQNTKSRKLGPSREKSIDYSVGEKVIIFSLKQIVDSFLTQTEKIAQLKKPSLQFKEQPITETF